MQAFLIKANYDGSGLILSCRNNNEESSLGFSIFPIFQNVILRAKIQEIVCLQLLMNITGLEQGNHLELILILRSSRFLSEKNLHFTHNALREKQVEFLKAVF